ncbi:SH3 domain-containing protein [Mycena albidolilacea]|uniref:SH3 domain-containing protein n=1 Tax=Mycena albidolilacea TaxID=1033008 RepID=A0AAD7EUE6_9AGAR|nr:SH3 domain-containing protein [Mycena albidolilacea]
MDSALFNHIISQTRQNVEFLISHKQISPADGREILAKLPNTSDRTMAALEQQTQNLLITPPPSTGPPSYPQTPAAQTVRAKALWDYGDGQSSQDLSFRAGDTIEIIEETNSDWWTGRLNGREGVFPANYVEKLASPGPSPYNARDAHSSNAPSMPSFTGQPAYQPPSGPPAQPAYQPPTGPPAGPYGGGYQPPTGGYQPAYQPPPSGPPQAAYQPPPGPPQQGGQYNSYGGPPPNSYGGPPQNSYGGPLQNSYGGPPPNAYGAPPPLAPKPSEAPAAAAPPPAGPQKESKFGKYGGIVASSAAGGLGFGAGSAVGSNIVNSIF